VPRALAAGPDLVTFDIGGNDLRRVIRNPEPAFPWILGNLDRALDRLGQTGAPIFVADVYNPYPRGTQLHEYGERPVVEEVAEPEVTDPLDVIVRIGGAGLCRTDLHIIEGQWQEKSGVELPYTLGHENAGWVHEVGSAVTNVAEGDAVIVHPLITCGLCRACRAGDDMHCEANLFPGISTNGGFAELLKTNARAVVKLPDGVEPKDVAAHADAGLTAYHAAAKAASRLTPRDRCVVIGAGGLGHIGIQVLKALSPAELIVVDRNPDAVKLAVEIGADHGVVAEGSHVEQVLELTDGQGAEVVVDFVGEGGATAEGVRMLRRAGDYHVVGYGENIDVPTIDIISTEINFIGNLVGSYNDLCELMVLAARGAVRLHTAKYALDDFQSAIDDLDAGRVRGRAILIP
jgi:NAD+-dependent secondary alcohol dehydrogenase Adh1